MRHRATILAVALALLVGFAAAQSPMWNNFGMGAVGSATRDITFQRSETSGTAELQLQFGTTPVTEYTFQPDSLIWEGATADAFELTMTITDPTADATASFTEHGASYAVMGSLLTTNAANVANSAWFATASTLVMEGATADAFETSIVPTDPTADRTITLPNAGVNVGRIRVTCRAQAVADQLDQSCFIADRIYTVVAIDEVHTIAESGGTLTIMPRKQEATEAPASGQALLSAGFNGVGTAETVLNGALTSTGADLIMAVGDRLGLDYVTDVAGELAGVVVTFTLDPS